MGTMGMNNDRLNKLPKPREVLASENGQSTLFNAAAHESEPVTLDLLCREVAVLKGAIHAMHQD